MVLYSINNLTFINLTATLDFNPLKYSGPKYVLPKLIRVYGVAAKIVDSTKQRSSLAHKHWAEFLYNWAFVTHILSYSEEAENKDYQVLFEKGKEGLLV